MKSSQETSLQAEILKNSQKVEFTNKITGKRIAKFSRGGINKLSVQAELLQFFLRVGIYKPILQAEIMHMHSFDKNEIWTQ